VKFLVELAQFCGLDHNPATSNDIDCKDQLLVLSSTLDLSLTLSFAPASTVTPSYLRYMDVPMVTSYIWS
jgi:hypothetical protein